MGKRIFISDVHLGAGRFSAESQDEGKYPNDWDWLSEHETKNFLEFLKYLESDYDKEIDEIVLLGDVFDNWIFPYDIVPPTMEELLQADKNKDVVSQLNSLADKYTVFYVPGNHDMHATKEIIGSFFKKFKFCQKRFSSGRLIGEHGHRYAMFNAPPRYSDNILGLPLGYFISRIEATRKALTGKEARTYRTYVDDFVEVLGKQTLSQSVLEAVIEEAELDEDIRYKYKRKGGTVQSISALEVKNVYKNIYNDWPTNVVSKHRAVFAELDMLGPIADKLCKDHDYQVCIFGHSHKSEVDKDTWFVNDRIYANTGFWCGSACSFIETEKTDSGYEVCLVNWLGQEEKEKKIKRGGSVSI